MKQNISSFATMTQPIIKYKYITYLGTYILPFIGLKVGSIFDMMAVTFMFLTIGNKNSQ